MKHQCDKCQKMFATKQNLQRHQKNSCKKLDIQRYECEYCFKTLSRQEYLTKHYDICFKKIEYDSSKILHKTKKKYQIKIKSYTTRIEELEDEVENLRSKNKLLEEQFHEHKGIVKGMEKAPEKKTIYNTAYIHPKLINLPINNVPALTHDYVIEKVNDGILTYEKATKGYRGILEVICDLITHENGNGEIERNYVCTDVSRNSFHRLLESKKWKSDKGGMYLNNILDTFRNVMEEYKNQAYEIYNETPHDSFEWSQVDWERKNVALLYNGIVCKEGSSGREELVNILRKEISKRASV